MEGGNIIREQAAILNLDITRFHHAQQREVPHGFALRNPFRYNGSILRDTRPWPEARLTRKDALPRTGQDNSGRKWHQWI